MNGLFGKTFDLLSTILDFRAKRHKIIASNVANLDTPGLDKIKTTEDNRSGGKDFSQVLSDAVQDINRLQKNADDAIASVQLDNTASVHAAMIALEKADISCRAMMQVRNKIL
jgi:flagellar hook-basal body complex protein FliE